MKEDFKKLIENGWLSEKEAETFLSDKNILECINECTSPDKTKILRALVSLPFDKVKVVILGKDPYPNPLDAHGLAFSSDNKATPDSLKNIFKAIDCAYGSHLFETGYNNLSKWVNEGVLLLNAGLTYSRVEGMDITKPERDKLQAKLQSKHMRVWKPFVKLIIQKILTIKNRPVVMMLWGNDAHNIVFSNIKDKDFKEFAHTREAVIVPNTSVMLLQTSHPSPLSVNRGGDFPDTAPLHFKKCDEYLGNKKIDWVNL